MASLKDIGVVAGGGLLIVLVLALIAVAIGWYVVTGWYLLTQNPPVFEILVLLGLALGIGSGSTSSSD